MKEVLVYFVLHKPSVEVPEAGQGASSLGMGVAAKHCPVQAELQAWNNAPVFMCCSLQALLNSLLPDRKMNSVGPKQMGLQCFLTLEILLKVTIIATNLRDDIPNPKGLKKLNLTLESLL